MRYYRTTGLIFTQMQELVRRVNGALEKPWSKRVGRPKSLGLYKAVEAACMYLRQNAAQEFIGDVRDTSQPTISRSLAVLVPLVKSVLEEFVPSAADAIEVVKGRVVLVDGTLNLAGPTKRTRSSGIKSTEPLASRAIDIPSRRDCRLGFRPAAREDARRESVQGDRSRRYPEGGRRRIRRQGLPGNWPGHPEEEAERRRANLVRQGIQLPDLIVPRTGRAACSPLQELEDAPHRLPPSVLHSP